MSKRGSQERPRKSTGDNRNPEEIKKAAEGSLFDVSGPYAEFLNSTEAFLSDFSDKERRQLGYESHGQHVDAKVNIYNHGGKIVSVSFRSPAEKYMDHRKIHEQFQGKLITRDILDQIAAMALEAARIYVSPKETEERARAARERVEKAKQYLSELYGMRDRVYEHPLYKENEELQELYQKISDKLHGLIRTLHTVTPEIEPSYLNRLEDSLASIPFEIETTSYETAKKNAASLTVPSDPESESDVYVAKIEGVNTMISTRRVTRYETSKYSRKYETHGFLSHLQKVTKEVDDWSPYFDGRIREQAVVRDAVRAVDLRLGALERQVVKIPDGAQLSSQANTETLFLQEAMDFADALVGAGEYSHKYVYDPHLAMQWGEKITSRMTLNEGIAYAKHMDQKIGHWQSSAQKSAAMGLFSGIHRGLLKVFRKESADARNSEQQQYYQEKALEIARLFRVDVTIKKRADNMLVAHKYHDRLRYAGHNHEFAMEMTKHAFNFEDLAFRHMTLTLRKADPLSAEVTAKWPGVQNQIEKRLGPKGMEKLEEMPAYNEMISKVWRTPTTIQESAERYAIFRQLKSLADGSQVDQGALQKDMQSILEPYAVQAAESFAKFIETNYSDLAYGKKTVAKLQLTKTQREAIAQLADMEGYGWFDFSDETWATIYMIGRVAGYIAIGVALGFATGGSSLLAQMAVGGFVMTATGVAIEGRSVDSVEEGIQVYGTEFAINTLSIGAGRVLAGGRYAAQLRSANPWGYSARQIFSEAMKKGGMQRIGQYYDEAVTLGARLTGATAEAAVDVTATSWVDTQLIPGTTFIENLQRNAMFLGLPFGMEFRRDVLRGLNMVPPQSLRNVHRLSGKITSEITTLSDLCGNAVDPHTLYRATDFDGVLANANIPDAATAKKIKDSLVRLKSLETERVQVFGDMDRLVRNRLDVMQRAGNYNETATGRAARVREGLDLLQFEGQSQDGSGRRINFDEPDSVYGDAILRAHDIGDPPYTPVQLRQKRQILLEHFTEDQVDTLIRTRIAGKKPTPNTYPPPPPPPRGKPYSKVSVDRTDLVSGLDTPVYELSLDGKKYRVADGTYVRLSSPGRSARGAEIPEGEYQIEFVATQGQAGKTEYQMALRPLNPEDVGGSYSIDFNKTRWKVMPDQVGMMKKNYQKPIAEKSATATTQNLVDVDSDDIFSTKRYESDRKDIASYDESKQVVSGIPEQKLKVDPAKVEAHVSSVRSAKRAELEKKTSQFVETDRTKTMPTPAPFALQPNQRVWVCQGVQTDAGAVIFNTKSQARLVSGPAIVRKQKGKFVLMQYGGSEADPQILTVEITPEIKKHLAIPKDLHKESVMRLSNRGNGWKLRMNFNAFNEQLHKMVFRELTYLHQRGMIDDWKFFHGGEMADGKTSTIYVGDARKAKIVTDYLESLFSDALWQHKNADDIEFGTYMTGRFEVSETPEVDQYIKKPVAASSGLSSPMEVAYSARFKQWSMEQKLQKIDEYFAEMYGPFYNGAFNDLPNLPSHLSVPQTSKTTPKPPPPPRRK